MIISVLANAGHVLAVQLVALLLLDAEQFGSFSLFYLAFALGSSLMLSLVSEAWARRGTVDGTLAEWGEYARASLLVSIALGAIATAGALAVPSLRDAALFGGVAVVLATFRTGARYHDARTGRSAGVGLGDVLGLVVTVGGALLLVLGVVPVVLESVVGVWAVSAAASLAATRPFAPLRRKRSRWLSDHREQIRPLIRDSLILDMGSIGTPLLLAPLLGLAGFGVYRAVSNVAAPVRLVLNPLRPVIADGGVEASAGRRRLGAVLVVSLLFGALSLAALAVIDLLSIDLGALSALAPYALPTGLFVAANFYGHYSYIVCRAHAAGATLLRGRVVQTVSAILFPIIGLIVAGLPGAIWGYALCTTASSVYWAYLASMLRRR